MSLLMKELKRLKDEGKYEVVPVFKYEIGQDVRFILNGRELEGCIQDRHVLNIEQLYKTNVDGELATVEKKHISYWVVYKLTSDENPKAASWIDEDTIL